MVSDGQQWHLLHPDEVCLPTGLGHGPLITYPLARPNANEEVVRVCQAEEHTGGA
jgi:hypothetical protein